MAEAAHTYRVVTIPLAAQPWQADLISKRMELCRSLYNALLDHAERRRALLQRDARYQEVMAVIEEAYRYQDGERELAKATGAYREAVTAQNELYRAYGLTQYSFDEEAARAARAYRQVLPSRVAHFTVGLAAWSAYREVLSGRKSGVRFKAQGTQRSLRSDGRSGIRLLGPDGKGHREGVELRETPWGQGQCGPAPLSVVYGKTSGRRVLRLPCKVERGDTYLLDALRCPLQQIGIVRMSFHGHEKLYVKLTLDMG